MGTELLNLINQRYVLGITDEPKQLLQPILGYALEPLLPLEDACEPILTIVPNLPAHIWIAKENSKQPSDGLTQDESAAIHLYTMEWDAGAQETRQSLYSHLNRTLKQTDRGKLRPWFRYLKLFLTAVAKLPPIPRQTIWRGVSKDMSRDYPKESRATWWGFSSCTSTLDVLESDLYLGNTGTRTLFSIETFSGRSIRAHSHFTAEDEILLAPGTYLEVISQLKASVDLNIIHLRQIRPPHQLLEPPFQGAELSPIIDSQLNMKKQLNSVEIEESSVSDHRSLFQNKKVRICLGLLAFMIVIAIILGAVLGTQLNKTKSSGNLLYWTSGPVVNLNPNILSGWNICYSGGYHVALHDILGSVLNQCNKTNLLMACRFINDTNYAVAAMGQRSDVTYETPTLPDFHIANNVIWYFDTNSSWGFAKATDTISRTPCDTTFGQDDDYRLCWHTVELLDGFRCGKAYFNLSHNYIPEQWLRFIYHAD